MSAALTIRLPTVNRTIEPYTLEGAAHAPVRSSGPFNRVAYAAAHIVADPLADNDPWLMPAIDWERTIAFREHLWDLGLGVAEAMDTAQRGMGLDWPASLELIRRTLAAAQGRKDARVVCGCGTDHLAPEAAQTLDDVIRAYEEQMAAIEKLEGRLVLMASRALARIA